MAVHVCRDRDAGVSEDLRHDIERNAFGQHHRRGRVPERLPADTLEPCLARCRLERAQRIAGITRLPDVGEGISRAKLYELISVRFGEASLPRMRGPR
jgi:hypothetical protein